MWGSKIVKNPQKIVEHHKWMISKKEEREITQSAKKLSGDEKKYNITNHAHVQTRLPAAAAPLPPSPRCTGRTKERRQHMVNLTCRVQPAAELQHGGGGQDRQSIGQLCSSSVFPSLPM
jgi:hypothetical protein